MLCANNAENIMTGKAVAREKTAGMIKKSLAVIARGINIPKKRTALKGQKARAKTTPNIKIPR